ncbi:MAG: isoprenylcysteine carboxylmethyltransferase family protein [Pseudomonadota bacterium]
MSELTIAQWAVILVGLQRLAELWLSHRNGKALLEAGGHEIGRGHYPVMIAIHAAWLAAIFYLVPADAPVYWPLVAAYLLVQVGRVWVIRSLGPLWTTRVIEMPSIPLVRSGPYRWVKHPNYVVVALEVALLPLIFGAWEIALVFSAANLAIIAWRLRLENASIARRAHLVHEPK